MTRYVLSPAARVDLEEIWDYTVKTWDKDQAEAYIREIQNAIERVSECPKIGRPCGEVRPGYRRHTVGSHTVYYRLTSAGVVDVVRILHQRMDVDRHLS